MANAAPVIRNNFIEENLGDGVYAHVTGFASVFARIINNTIVRNGGTGISHPSVGGSMKIFNN
ncbi:MAG: hypothetical protein U0903_07420 [Planctomycetales bacterium]